MSALLRQLGWLVLSVSILYGVLWVGAVLVDPGDEVAQGLYSARAPKTFYMTEPKYVFMSRAPLAVAKPRVIFIGASNTVVGFNPAQIDPLLHNVEVDNLGIGGANVTEIAEVVDLIQQVQSPAARKQTTYVLGMWYGIFFGNHVKWYSPERHAGDTDIDIEQFRYGFYRRSEEGPVALLPPRFLAAEVLLVRPFLVLDRLSRQASRGLRGFVHNKPDEDDDQVDKTAVRNASVVSEAKKAEDIEYWKQMMQDQKQLPTEQVQALRDLIGKILASGSKIMLVDLPIPSWHKARSPIFASYVEQRDAVVRDFAGKPGFSFFDMSAQDQELDFSDEVHPKPRVTINWASSVSAPLQQFVSP
jgi:hypothetical protein